MADDTQVAAPESPATRTFQIPVENAAPVDLEHQGRKFKIPVEGHQRSFKIPVEAPPEPEKPNVYDPEKRLQAHSDVSVHAWTPSWWDRVKQTFTTGVGRNLGFGESFAHERARTLERMTPGQYHEYQEDQKKQHGKWYNMLESIPYLSAISGSPTDELAIETRTPAINVGALMTREDRGAGAPKDSMKRELLAGSGKILDAISEFTSPESAKSQLQWMVGGTLLEPIIGVGLGVAGAGAAKAGMSSVAKFLANPKTAAWALKGTFFGPILKDLGISSYHAVQHSDSKDPEHEEGAWGDIVGNLVTLVGLHYGMKAVEAGPQRRYTEDLNKSSQDLYKKKFTDLDQQQKVNVLYDAVGTADADFKARVDQEVEKIRKVRGKEKGTERAQKIAVDLAQEHNDRMQAAKTVLNQAINRMVVEAAARQEASTREAEALRAQAAREAQMRREQYEQERAAAEAAEAARSEAEKRGFEVEESRTAENLPVTGLRKTTEREPGERYEPEPTAPAVPVTERRAAAREPIPEPTPAVVAAESKVQELAEQRMGTSWSALPLGRQMVAARWLERFHPGDWLAFTGTPAHAEFAARVKDAQMADAALKHYLDRNATGSEEPLAPGADLQTGLAKLIIGRTDVDSALKDNPETHRALNEHAEESMGKSWDSLPEDDRPAALAEFLRDKPDSLAAFLTPDLTTRIKSGQHIDLANMEAELADKQQVHTLMEFRDQIRRDMDAGVAAHLLTEAANRRRVDVSGIWLDAQSSEDPALRAINTATKELTAQGEELGLGPADSTDDLFRIEKAVKDTPDRLRTAKMRAFVARMEQARSQAEDYAARRLAEATVQSFTVDPEAAREKAARQMIWYDGQAHDLQDAADNLRERGKTEEADSAQSAADDAKRKADAIVVGVQTATNPPAPPAPEVSFPISTGGTTRIVSPTNKAGMPAHYAIMEMTDAQTSHMPHTYEYREGFNQNGQPRDYKINRDAQAAIKERTAKLDLDILLSNDPQTMGGSSVIDQRGHVISGNGRMLSVLESLTTNPTEYARYRDELMRRAATFGIEPSEISKFRNPILVRVMDAPVETDIEWARLGTELNADPTIGLSDAEQGVAMGRLLTPEYIDRLGNIIDSMPSVDKEGKPLTAREAMRDRSGEIAQLMTDAGIIKGNKRREFLDDEGNLNERAKDAFENLLAGVTVTNPDVLQRAPASVKDRLTRVGMFFIRMQQAGENWNLASMNTDAVRLITRARDAAGRLEMLMSREEMAKRRGEAGVLPGVTGSESLVEKYLHPERYHYSEQSLDFDGQPLHAPVHAGVESLAMALEERPRDYSLMMARFADRAHAVQATMFGAESPAEAFTAEIASKYGMKVIPEEWGSVVGMSDAVKASIEEGRGPLPVEPEVHAETAIDNVLPNSESVTEAIPEGPRNVRELREALETHPGVTPEDAAAITEVIENILPRAIGEDLNDILGNRRLNFKIGGVEGRNRGYHEILEDGRAIIAICDSGDVSTALHELAHYIRRYLRPEDQKVANEFVAAKPGEEWTDEQEEMFSEAFERYHFDGGIRRGKLEKVFAKIHRAMQSIYNAVTGSKLAKGTQALNQMFDNWYDWSRAERKPLTARLDVDALIDAAKGKVEIPSNAKVVQGNVLKEREFSDKAQNYVFTDEQSARQFINDKKNGIKKWQIFKTDYEEGSTVYVRAEGKKGKKLFQASLDQMITLAKQAQEIEKQLKRTFDPREQARLRGLLNGIEDKMRGATGIIGGAHEPKDTSVIQLVHGVGEMPTVSEPTTPAQAVTAHGVFGDPTSFDVGGERGKPGEVPAEATRVPESEGTAEVPRGAKPADREHGISTPKTDPLAKVKAAKLKAPDVARGTPVVDPAKWREHVEALGLPTGTPPPTVRMNADARELMIYPGQSEGVEGVLSALQQYDGTILASPPGSGKCLGRGTPVLMFDGTIKAVEDVIIGDLLMGPDSKPRTVLSLAHGWDEMYKVTPTKGNSYVVNKPHILSLKFTNSGGQDRRGGKTINIPVEDFLKKSKNFQSRAKGYRAGVEFPERPVEVPPYLLGLWLGDGTSNILRICNKDEIILSYVKGIADAWNMKVVDNRHLNSDCASLHISSGSSKANPLWKAMVELGLKNNKHIPNLYLANSENVRRELLAGLLDSDGYLGEGIYVITLKIKKLVDDVLFLARSLGLAAYMTPIKHKKQYKKSDGVFYRIRICGDLSQIPCKLHRRKAAKRKSKKSVLSVGITVSPIGRGEYFGFEIDGDRLFMLGDFTVTHNTYMLSAIANEMLGTGGDKVGLLITRSTNLIHEADGFVETARKFGLDVNDLPSKTEEMQTGMYAATYAAIRGNRDVLSIPWDFVLFDESAEGRNWTESDQGKAVVLLGHAAKKVVYSSATPHSTIMELGYMHKLGLWPKGGFAEWAYQFGLREVGPNTYSGGTSAAKLEKLRQQLVERGQWQQLYRDMEGTEAHVVLVPQTDEVRAGIRNIRAAFAMARMAFQRARMSRYITPAAGHEVIYLKRFIEAQRLPQLIATTKKAVDAGWRPVIFSEYRSGSDTGMDFFNNLPGDLGKKINAMLPPLPDVVETLRKEFGTKIGIFAGEANQLRAGELEEFQGGNKDAIYMTYAAGGVGANAGDKVGDKPRMGIFSGLPWSGIMFEQGTSRTWRYGTKSGVINIFFTSDTLPEMKVLATKILPRMRSLNAAVRGDKIESKLSKNLRESAGIPEELLQYEHGQEVSPQSAEFEQEGSGVGFTHIDDYEIPQAKQFHGKGMKYKGEGRKLYQSAVERRQNAALRKRIAEMTPEEMRRTLLTSEKVDLPNGRAFDEAERDHPAPAVAMSDADGLKAFNDKFGYEAGDALLKAKADALKAAGLNAYHEKGDEFLYRGNSKEELIGKLERARDILRSRVFDVTMDDGQVLHLKGVDFSYGTGTELHEAESGLHSHKAEREALGERKRGELAGITEVGREGEERPAAVVQGSLFPTESMASKVQQHERQARLFQRAKEEIRDRGMPRRNAIGSHELEHAISPEALDKMNQMFKRRTASRDLREMRAAMEIYDRLLKPGPFDVIKEPAKKEADALRDSMENFLTGKGEPWKVQAAMDDGLRALTGEDDPDIWGETLEGEVFASAQDAGKLIFDTLDPKTASFDLDEFNTAFGDVEFRREPDEVFPEPEKSVNISVNPRTGKAPIPDIPQAEADKIISEWKETAQQIGKTQDNKGKVVYSLYDVTGNISKPWEEAGYTVRRFDIKNGVDLTDFGKWMGQVEEDISEGLEVYGVLAQPPCTSFAVSGTRWWKTQHDIPNKEMVEKKYGLWAAERFDTPLDYANTLAAVTKLFVAQANPSGFYVQENPIGRMRTQQGLPSPTLTFDPSNYGDPYTKKTQLWGQFNPDLPTANVYPTEGSKIHKLRGDVEEEKAQRSETSLPFAYAFFMANHDIPSHLAAGAEHETTIAPEPRESVAKRVEERRKLFQGPRDGDNDAVNSAWEEMIGRTKDLPAATEHVVTAHEGTLKSNALRAARQAREAGENPREAASRTLRDAENDALIWLDDMKDHGRAATHFLKSTVWMFGTSGDRAVEAICRDAGFAKDGAELKRRMIDYDLRSGNYRGEFGGMIEKIISENRLKPPDLEMVSKVVEGQAESDDPRIMKAVKEFRQFTSYVRRRLAASGMSVVFYDEAGKRVEVPYSQIQDDPHYWPRVYDWNRKFVVEDGQGGKIVTSLGEIMHMPTGSERREMLIEKVAKQRGISKVKAQLFFDKNARGIRLAGNLERSREFEIPLYGRDRRALDRYVNEVAEKLASTEVHGQFREKTDPIIDALPNERTRRLVNHIITSDLDPARLHDSDRFMLRQANRWLVLSKMSLSTLKLPFHLARTTLATNTRSLALALMKGITSPKQLRQNAVDCGAMVNYLRTAWMREYGMRTGGLDQKLLDFNGFTLTLYASRMIAAGAGRLWFEKYAYPELKRNPQNAMLRRKLGDLYGYTEDQLDTLVEKGYGPGDVKRVELGAANWTTGSGRPTELPPALRGTSGDPLYDRFTTLLRISQSLHGYMFKTANLVNRTVWQEILKADPKSVEPYKLIARFSLNFGLAGLALSEILHIRHQMSGSPEADIEKRRQEWLAAHPASKEALFTAMADISLGMGVDALTQFFDELATHDPKDKQKMVQQERAFKAAQEFVTGVAYQDMWTAIKAMKDYEATFEDTGPHKQTPEERRKNISERLLNEEVPISRYAIKPTPAPTSSFPHQGRPKHMF